ncbi:MAG: peptide ABC transporter permease [Methanomicrobiales archaeon HGW-Methanomicrobiales-4]|nr:MAG: peptide ABC transporter permease [Methanomicrobiales archaeon HGW-Methanomicrobiales-4]
MSNVAKGKNSSLLKTPGVIILVLIFCIAIFAPFLTSYDPDRADLSLSEQKPSITHWCGTDKLGRDVFTRTIYGTRISLMVGISAAFVAVFLGACIGLLAGFFGGWTDSILMRIVDTVNSPPETILLIVLVTMFPRSVLTIILIIGLTHWMSTSRMIRGESLSLKERPFVEAAVALGAGNLYIIRKHILPNLVYVLVISVSLMAAHAILTESFLSFLGLGIPAHLASWGNMMNEGQRDIMRGIWWTTLFPGIMIILTVLSIYLVGDSLKDRFVPKREMRSEI